MLTYFNSVFPEQNFTRITNNNLKKFLKMRKEAGAKVKFSGSKAALLAAVEEDAVKNFQEAWNNSQFITVEEPQSDQESNQSETELDLGFLQVGSSVIVEEID